MRVSVFNICSEAIDLLKFSTKYAFENAGNEFDYILILWNPSKEVEDYAKEVGNVFYYKTDKNLDFIQNLRNCFNMGFNKGFEFNNYTCGINTDMAFYKNWLKNLVKFRKKDSIINCRQIEPNPTPYHEVANFGCPGENFDLEGFYIFCNNIYEDRLISEEEWGRRCDATPHLISREIWEKVGEWNVKSNNPPSDVRWFNKAKLLGFKNTKSLGSIVYHYGREETRRMEEKIKWR